MTYVMLLLVIGIANFIWLGWSGFSILLPCIFFAIYMLYLLVNVVKPKQNNKRKE